MQFDIFAGASCVFCNEEQNISGSSSYLSVDRQHVNKADASCNSRERHLQSDEADTGK